ncbi:MAG: DUF86 domain-containing protein [Chloroflexota bacterium]
MTAESDHRHLTYIQQAIGLIERRTRPGRDAFLDDVDMQDAVLWRLETLAEATNRLSTELKARHPEIRWRAIYGFRNIAAHGYIELQIDRVWEIVDVHLPQLKQVIDDELARSA